MKRIKLLILLFMFSLMILVPNTAKAAQNVNEDGISITNIGTTTANVDWSGTAVKYTSMGYAVAGFSTDGVQDNRLDYNNNVPDTPSTQQTTEVTQTPDITLQVPKITEVKMSETKLGAVAGNIDSNARSLEWQIIDVKNGNKVVATDTSYTTGNIFYNMKRKLYAVQCRAVGYDSNYNNIYSDWSAKSYVIAQPEVSTSKKYLKKNSITVSFKKIKGAKDYTIYMRKKGSSKWTKVKTTKKNKYKVTKFKGKSINLAKKSYEFCVIANAKVGKKTIKSSKSEYVYTVYY